MASGHSVLLPYGGRPLRSGQACAWTVLLRDQEGRWSDPATPACWSIGLLRPEDWHASWIGLGEKAQATLAADWIGYAHPDWANAEPDHTQYFRRSFVLPAPSAPGAGVLLLAADWSAAVWIDGNWVGGAEGWDAAKHIELPALAAGEHVLAATVGRHDGARKPAALAASLEVRCTDGQLMQLGTDARWLCADWVLPGWKGPVPDASDWGPAKVLAAADSPPWGPGPVPAPGVQAGPAAWLRREVVLDRPVRRATVYVSGLGWSELWINGTRAGDAVLSPGLADYGLRAPYVTYEVAGLLRPGPNAVGVVLGNGRFRAPRPSARDFGAPRLRLQVELAYADVSTDRLVSDEGWQGTTDGPVRSNNEYDGEAYDARLEMPGWSEPGFAAQGWVPARLLPPPGGAMTAASAEPSRVTGVIQPIGTARPRPGSKVFDFGQNVAGVCRVRASGPAGAELVLRHAERLHANGTLDVANLRGARATDCFVLSGEGGTRAFQPRFTTHGFRYAELTGSGPAVEAATVEACVVGDDLARTGRFACSNPLLNRIHEAIAWGVRANCRSIRTDCPQRDERQGWLGDVGESSRGEAMMFGNAAFYAKWLGDIADTQRPDGSVSDVAPSYWPVYEDDVAWPATMLALPGMLLDHYGDRAPLERHFGALERWVGHMRGYVRDGALARDRWGDWGAPPQEAPGAGAAAAGQDRPPAQRHEGDTPGALIGTAYFVRCLDLMARYARLLGRDPCGYEVEAAAMRTAFHATFYDRGAGRYGAGDATSSILALGFGLVPAELRAAEGARLVHTIEEAGRAPCFGLVGAQWVNRVLTGLGRADLAYAMATRTSYPGLGYMVAQGATTLWELWNGDRADPAMSSGNHTMLMGDLPLWLYQHLGGIAPDPARPGFERILIQPQPAGDLEWAEAEHHSARGKIAVRWRLTGSRLVLDAEVPPNAEALLTPPAGSRGVPWISGRGAGAAPRPDGRSWALRSGRYEFRTEWRRPYGA